MSRRRSAAGGPQNRSALVAVVIAALALVLAACASPIDGSGRLATPTGTPGPSPSEVQASRTCPSIVDPVAHLSYTCVDDSLERTFGPTYDLTFAPDGTVLTRTTEPGWVASQQSGVVRVEGSSEKDVAQAATEQQAADNYGDNPSPGEVLERDVPGLGEEAYRIDTLITLDGAYVKERGLTARTEMLSTVVVRLADDTYVALSLSIPDTQKDWWPRFDSVIASLKVV